LNLPGRTTGLNEVAFNPDGSRLASVGWDRVLQVFDSQTGHMLWETNDPRVGDRCVCYSPDGRWLATGDWNTNQVWIRDAQTGLCVLPLGTNGVGRTWSLAFSPDSCHLAASTEPYGLRIWTITEDQTAAARSRLKAEPVTPRAPDSADGPKAIGTFSPLSVTFSPDSRCVAFWSDSVSKPESVGALYVWNFAQSAKPVEIASPVGPATECESFSPDGRSVIAQDAGGAIVTLDPQTGKRLSAFPAESPLKDHSLLLRLSPDGSKVAIATASNQGVDIWDLHTRVLVYALPGESSGISCLAWSPDSRRLAVSRDNGDIAIWNLDTVAQILTQLGLNP
jgi:WD40 repeat protein